MLPAAPTADALIGEVVDGRYKICRVLGRGGMGVVYEAEAIRLGKRPCAIKVLLPEFTRNDNVVARFSREAEVAARVKHPNVVEIFDTGTTTGNLGYIAMELLVGEPLDRTLRREGSLAWPRARHVVLQICRALAAAHAHGVIHRDIKPENCFRVTWGDDPDFIKVLDFGIAKLTDLAGDEAPRLTATNSVIGTYAYMAYEQICGEPIDHRVDIWAVGVILYELLTGRLPFRGANQGQIWTAISRHDPEPMRNVAPHADIPAAADALVLQALAKDRDQRFPTVEAFARALVAITDDGHTTRGVTAKLAFPPTSAPAVDVAAETAVGGPDLAVRPTQAVSPHGLTELGPDELRPATHETVHAVTSASTHPGRDLDLPPPREALPTDLAPAAVAAVHPPPGRPANRLVKPLLGLSTLTVLVVLVAAMLPGRDRERAPRQPDAPATVTPPVAPPVAPPAAPPVAAPPASALVIAPPDIDPPVVDPPDILKPARAKPRDKPPESFHDRVLSALKSWKSSRGVKDCLREHHTKPTMSVTIAVPLAGPASLDVGPLKNSAVDLCLRESLAGVKLPRPGKADAAFPPTPYTLGGK